MLKIKYIQFKWIIFIISLLSTNNIYASIPKLINPNSPDGFVKIHRKIQCNIKDGIEETFVWKGRAYSRVPGERDKHLFNLIGMNIRQCKTVRHPKRGEGFNRYSRELMFYLDPKSNKIIHHWKNPWTEKNVSVAHVANDPVNSHNTLFGITEQGKHLSFNPYRIGSTWQMPIEVPLFYKNPLAGDYQNYVGNQYHATEIFDFSGDWNELLDENRLTSYPRVAWIRIAQWLPWMEMGSRAGLMYFNAQGGKLKRWDDLPIQIKEQIWKHYPLYQNAPPMDDKRSNETSWTAFKKQLNKNKQ